MGWSAWTSNNLPHGVIVDNIGLNAVLIPAESRAANLLNCAKFVPETIGWCMPWSKPRVIRLAAVAAARQARSRSGRWE